MKALRLRALIDLCRRYANVWRARWAVRQCLFHGKREQFDAPKTMPWECDFQLAHLKLARTPMHRAPRWCARVIVILPLSAILIMAYAKLDIVVSAKGKLVQSARVKVIQPAFTGVVREIAVRDGQRVRVGQLLLRLDATPAAANEDGARSAQQAAALAAACAQALLNAQQDEIEPRTVSADCAPAQRQQEGLRVAEGVWREYENRFNAARTELTKREAELDRARQDISRLVGIAALAREQADDAKALAGDRYVARHDWFDNQYELAARRGYALELSADIARQRAELNRLLKYRRFMSSWKCPDALILGPSLAH